MMQDKIRSNGQKVLKQLRANKFKKYPRQSDSRFDTGMLFPNLAPSFQLKKGASVFTIGSCFARNIETKLLELGLNVPTREFSAPASEAGGGPQRLLNQYNPGSMSQFTIGALEGKPLGGMYDMGDGLIMDSLLSTGQTVNVDRANERREEIVTLYREGIAKSDAVFITLGLIETWIDLKERVYLNDAPPMALLRSDPKRFAFVKLPAQRSARLIAGMIEALVREKPRNIILTVSPVPLRTTFGASDAAVANGYSKAVLRVVAEKICTDFECVDYFPSYEMVSTMGFEALKEDNIHVLDDVVGRVVTHMTDAYVI